MALLQLASDALLKLIDGLKYLVAALFIRRSTKIEVQKDEIKKASEIKTEQLRIAAQPPADAAALRRRMRDGQL